MPRSSRLRKLFTRGGKNRQIRAECGKEIETDEDMEATIDEMCVRATNSTMATTNPQ